LLRNIGADQSGVSFGLRYNTGKEYFVNWLRFENCSIVGAPGAGKTTLLLHLILQNIENRHGVLVIDPVGDLVDKVLSHIPVNLADRVVYIDPLKSHKLKRSVQINPLEPVTKRDLVVSAFVESLALSYEKIGRNSAEKPITAAAYSLLNAGNSSISRLYHFLTDAKVRETVTKDLGVQEAFPNISTSVTSAIRALAYDQSAMMFCDCPHSSVSFEEILNKNQIVLVKLAGISEGTKKFIAATLLAQTYFAVLKTANKPFFVYIDDAKFIPLPWHIQTLLALPPRQNFRVVMATYFLEDFSLEVEQAVLTLCNTFIAFHSSPQSARKLGDFFDGQYRESVIRLPNHEFILAPKSREGMVWGQKETVHLCTIDKGYGPNKPTDTNAIIKISLDRYGRWVG